MRFFVILIAVLMVVGAAYFGSVNASTNLNTPPEISGEYKIYDSSQGVTEPPKGTLSIVKNNQYYQVVRTIGTDRITGTGVLSGEQFSVTYQKTGSSQPGYITYRVIDDRHLQSGNSAHQTKESRPELLVR